MRILALSMLDLHALLEIFIEKVSNGQGRKTITVVGVEHVASAIATLGLTTLNIAADNVIQFLTQNIAMLSRLLQDNLVRSLLAKEKFWKNDKGTINKYPFLRTEQRSVTVGKHSIGDHKANIADHLRSIITEMGNALGLMRILLAGCSRHSWRISSFICKPRNVTSFMESCQKLGFTDRIDTAVKVMDIAMENKYQSVYDTDYFCLLVSAISKELQSNESLDLRDFFLLIPALIISLIDSKIHFKEKSLRRDREPGNQITADDGFIIGVAYILKVTGQDKSFDKLQWFASANKHFEEAMLCLDDRSRRLDQQKGSKIFGLKLWNQAPTSISPEVQKRQQKEMRLIEYAFNIARTIMS